MKRVIGVLMALALICMPAYALADDVHEYAFVVKDVQNPYMQKMYEGFQAACAELGVEPSIEGSSNIDAIEQGTIIDRLVDEGVTAIAVAVSSDDGVADPLRRALAAEIKVVSVDSAADVSCRMTHIQQVDPSIVSRAMVQAAHRMIGGSGEVAILTTTETMPNQKAWVSMMLNEVESHPDTYANMTIVEVAYGRDERKKSTEETERLLDQYPDLKIIIAPTSIGMAAAAKVIQNRGSSVLITGLGLPSDMEPYIKSGTCPWMYLWNPIDMGYLAAYALNALETGALSGGVDETFTSGRLGEKIITKSLDGGTEIVVGNPYKFDQGNILSWRSAF